MPNLKNKSTKTSISTLTPKKAAEDDYNWYDKLHPIGVSSLQKKANSHKKNSPPLNLSLFFRIWLAVALIIVLSGLIVFNQLFNYVRPVTQQVIEDTLVDTAEVLATALQQPFATGEIYNQDYQEVLDTAFQSDNPATLPSKHRYENKKGLNNLSTWYHNKTHSSFRVYVTDSDGQVIYDSRLGVDNAEGEDYSQWNDVYRTLNGEYGARTTRQNPDDPNTSVMYVAKPIYTRQAASASKSQNQNVLIGVVSVGKPTATITPYLNATRQRMLMTSAIISIVALILAGLVAWWLQQSMRLVTRYTKSLAQDANKPYFFMGRELNELSDTIETMKHKLENRAYVTDYVHTLTHELKSPLTAIRASGELLEDTDLDVEDRVMLSQTITEQSIKLQALIDRLLLLAKIEQPAFRLTLEPIDLSALMATLIRDNESQSLQNEVSLTLHTQANIEAQDNADKIADAAKYVVHADRFWLTQALQNIMDNALYFAKQRVDISLRRYHEWIEIAVYNDGNLIPDYALSKVFDRYFSLSHNAHSQNNSNHTQTIRTNKKGTGLGLTLVRQVIKRHQGSITIANIEDAQSGVLVTIRLPIEDSE